MHTYNILTSTTTTINQSTIVQQTLKNLYRLFEPHKEVHHLTVSNIVKGIWPSYRIMRKQHETTITAAGKNNSKTVFVVD